MPIPVKTREVSMAKSDSPQVKSTQKVETDSAPRKDAHANPMKHNALAVLLAGVAVVLLLIITFTSWAKNNLYDTEAFSNHVVTAVQSEEVRNAIASGVTEELYDDNPILGRLLSNTTKSFISSQLASDTAGNILDEVATRLQERAIRGNNEPVVIDISGFTSTLASIRDTLAPDFEPEFELPQGDDARIVILKGDEIPSLKNAGVVMLAVLPFAMLGLITLTIVSWFKVGSKPRFLKITGIVLVVTGTLVLIFTNTTTAQLSLIANNANQATILEAVYTEFIASLRSFQSILIGSGLAIIVLTALYERRSQIGDFAKKVRKSSDK